MIARIVGATSNRDDGLGDLVAKQLIDLVAGHGGVLDDVVQPRHNLDPVTATMLPREQRPERGCPM